MATFRRLVQRQPKGHDIDLPRSHGGGRRRVRSRRRQIRLLGHLATWRCAAGECQEQNGDADRAENHRSLHNEFGLTILAARQQCL
jgi:hypothetical protein